MRVEDQHRWKIWLLTILLPCLLAGCPRPAPQPGPIDQFDVSLLALAGSLQHPYGISGQSAPVALVSSALKTDRPFTGLDEMILDTLAAQLRQRHDLYHLSRRNCFEYREGRPLSFLTRTADRRALLEQLVVYQVDVAVWEAASRAVARVSATDAMGRGLPGVAAQATLDFSPGSLARQLYEAPPRQNPFPRGLAENPYHSLDRLAFSLAAELADACRDGAAVGAQRAADADVQVLLYAKTGGGLLPGQVRTLQNALQQAVVRQQGFTCVLSREDFGSAFDQIDFYAGQPERFSSDQPLLTAGTVLLMLEPLRPFGADLTGVALRGAWRQAPVQDRQGRVVAGNSSGTYVSGFAAQAYLSAVLPATAPDIRNASAPVPNPAMPPPQPPPAPTVILPRPTPALVVTQPQPTPAPVVTQPQPTPAPAVMLPQPMSAPVVAPQQPLSPPAAVYPLSLCFFDFTAVLQKRVYPVLHEAPGVSAITRRPDLCAGKTRCLCYQVAYDQPVEVLEAHLQTRLRTGKPLAFYIQSTTPDLLEIYFDGGFE